MYVKSLRLFVCKMGKGLKDINGSAEEPAWVNGFKIHREQGNQCIKDLLDSIFRRSLEVSVHSSVEVSCQLSIVLY